MNENFFFSDAFSLAQMVAEYHPQKSAELVRAADNIAAQRFYFSLHWDAERLPEPVVFENEINWLYQPGNDPEWVYAFNRMRFWVCLGQAYALTKDEKYAQAFVNQMLHWVKNIKQANPKCEKAWRSIEVGLRMEYWLKAMQYFKNSTAVTPAVTKVFTQSMVEHAEFIMGVWNTFNLMSNWGVLANHGLFMAGLMLPQTARTAEYTAEAARRLTAEIDMQVYRDGVHWEQSPMYHNEVLHCFLDVVLLAQRRDVALPEELVKKTRDMCFYCIKNTKPNHHMPLTGDSDDIDQRAQITKGAVVFASPQLKACGHTTPDFETMWDIGKTGMQLYQSLAATPPKETDFFLENSGGAFMRSGWGKKDTWVHFHCGTLGAGHGHADKMHVDITTRGDDILTDAGRYTYVFCKERVQFKQLCAHNTIMVDSTDLYTCKDSWECESLTRAVNQHFYANKNYAYAEGGHLGYTTLPHGVFLNRRVIYLKPDIIVLADEYYTNGQHNYNQFFNFAENGTLEKTSEKFWKYTAPNSQTQICFVAAESAGYISFEKTETKISRGYNQCQSASGIKTEFAAKGSGCVYTVFALGGKEAASARGSLQIEKLPVKSNFKGVTFGNDEIEALDIKYAGQHFVLVVAHKEFATPTDTFLAGGCTGFGSAVVFARHKNEEEIGTVLAW